MTWPHTTSRAYLGLLIVLGLVLAGPDLFRVWASLSPKAAFVHWKARPYGIGCVWTQRKGPSIASIRVWQGLPQTLRTLVPGMAMGIGMTG